MSILSENSLCMLLSRFVSMGALQADITSFSEHSYCSPKLDTGFSITKKGLHYKHRMNYCFHLKISSLFHIFIKSLNKYQLSFDFRKLKQKSVRHLLRSTHHSLTS